MLMSLNINGTSAGLKHNVQYVNIMYLFCIKFIYNAEQLIKTIFRSMKSTSGSGLCFYLF